MAYVVSDIQVVRSLRKNIRDITVPPTVLSSIESIHNCIRTGTDQNGWKKVEWRGTSSSTFETVRTWNEGHTGARGGRPNQSFGGRYKSEHRHPPQHHSVPLTNTVTTAVAAATTVATPTTATASTTSNSVVALTHPHTQSHRGSDGFRGSSHVKYVSKFKKSNENVQDTILNTIILGKLNKFSEQNYDEIKEFITHIIDSGETEMIKHFMKLVFEKAASEEIYCPLYARLLSEISSRFPILLTEMANLYSQYMEIFDETCAGATTANLSDKENYNEVCKRNVEKKYRRGYSQFLAELIKYDVIDTEIFHKTISKILYQVELNSKIKESTKLNEEFADCFMKIMKAILHEKDYESMSNECQEKMNAIRQLLKYEIVNNIKPFTEKNSEMVGISNKARFTFLDIYESIQKI